MNEFGFIPAEYALGTVERKPSPEIPRTLNEADVPFLLSAKDHQERLDYLREKISADTANKVEQLINSPSINELSARVMIDPDKLTSTELDNIRYILFVKGLLSQEELEFMDTSQIINLSQSLIKKMKTRELAQQYHLMTIIKKSMPELVSADQTEHTTQHITDEEFSFLLDEWDVFGIKTDRTAFDHFSYEQKINYIKRLFSDFFAQNYKKMVEAAQKIKDQTDLLTQQLIQAQSELFLNGEIGGYNGTIVDFRINYNYAIDAEHFDMQVNTNENRWQEAKKFVDRANPVHMCGQNAFLKIMQNNGVGEYYSAKKKDKDLYSFLGQYGDTFWTFRCPIATLDRGGSGIMLIGDEEVLNRGRFTSIDSGLAIGLSDQAKGITSRHGLNLSILNYKYAKSLETLRYYHDNQSYFHLAFKDDYTEMTTHRKVNFDHLKVYLTKEQFAEIENQPEYKNFNQKDKLAIIDDQWLQDHFGFSEKQLLSYLRSGQEGSYLVENEPDITNVKNIIIMRLVYFSHIGYGSEDLPDTNLKTRISKIKSFPQ